MWPDEYHRLFEIERPRSRADWLAREVLAGERRPPRARRCWLRVYRRVVEPLR